MWYVLCGFLAFFVVALVLLAWFCIGMEKDLEGY